MISLKLQKRLAASVLKCGYGKVWQGFCRFQWPGRSYTCHSVSRIEFYKEWQKALYSIGGSEVKKWSLQLRRSVPDGMAPSSNGTSLHQHEICLLHDRTNPSSSPSYGTHSKSSSFMKGGLGQPSSRKLVMGGVDNSRGLLQWVRSITFVSVSIDHSLQLLFQADSSGSSQSNGFLSQPSYIEGYTPVRSLGSTSSTYVFIPTPSVHFLPPFPLQLPTRLTAESPPLAHLLHRRGSAIPLCTAFVVSKAVPSMKREAVASQRKNGLQFFLSVSLTTMEVTTLLKKKPSRVLEKEAGV